MDTTRMLIVFVISIIMIILMIAKFKIHAFLSLLLVGIFFGLGIGMDPMEVSGFITSGFGGTMQSIGIVIVCGVIIGEILEVTGGAQKIADSILRVIGRDKAVVASSLTGAFISIPVFCDSGFIILNPVIKSISALGNMAYAPLVVGLQAGLLLTHSFVPPTPGPVAASALYEADIGRVMLYGMIVAIPVALLMAVWANSKFIKGKFPEVAEIETEDLRQQEDFSDVVQKAPSTFNSYLPIIVPITIIILASFFGDPEGSTIQKIIQFFGTPWIALIIGVLIAFTLPSKLNEVVTSNWVANALAGGAEVLLITAAAGGFAGVLRATPIGTVLAQGILGLGLPAIIIPYLMAMLINIATGSATVALTTVPALLAPVLADLGLSPEIAVLATAAGSMSFCHTNSSYFWAVSKLAGFDVSKGYQTITTTSVLMGAASMVIITILSIFV